MVTHDTTSIVRAEQVQVGTMTRKVWNRCPRCCWSLPADRLQTQWFLPHCQFAGYSIFTVFISLDGSTHLFCDLIMSQTCTWAPPVPRTTPQQPQGWLCLPALCAAATAATTAVAYLISQARKMLWDGEGLVNGSPAATPLNVACETEHTGKHSASYLIQSQI